MARINSKQETLAFNTTTPDGKDAIWAAVSFENGAIPLTWDRFVKDAREEAEGLKGIKAMVERNHARSEEATTSKGVPIADRLGKSVQSSPLIGCTDKQILAREFYHGTDGERNRARVFFDPYYGAWRTFVNLAVVETPEDFNDLRKTVLKEINSIEESREWRNGKRDYFFTA